MGKRCKLEVPLKRKERKKNKRKRLKLVLLFWEKMQCWVRVRLRRRTDPN